MVEGIVAWISEFGAFGWWVAGLLGALVTALILAARWHLYDMRFIDEGHRAKMDKVPKINISIACSPGDPKNEAISRGA